MGRMAYLFLFAILFYTEELSQAKSVNKSSNGPKITTRIGQVNNSNASSSSSSSTKVVLFRVGSQDTRQQRCRCVLFYQCENTDVVDVTSPEFLNESDIVCALGSEVCCREPVYLGGTTQQPSVTDIAITPITFNNTGLPPCVCVPSDQCAVGDPEALYSGAGKLDVRFTDCLSGEICCFPDELISTVGGGSSPTPLSPPTTPSTQEISTDVQPVTPPLVDIITPPVGAHTECGVRSLYRDSINTRIISPPGISDTEFGEFPWMAVIVRTDFEEGQRHDNVFHCGASFLSRSIIMTAAHCVYNMDRSRLKVRVGEYNTRFGVKREPMPHQDSSVSSIITHPDFNTKTMFNDIAIIVVETPFNLTPNVNPICMPSNDLPYDRTRCIATGWGQNSFDEGRFHDTLKKVELGLVPNDECQQRLRLTRLQKYFKLDPSFICAGGVQGADTCKGDGGGPLVCEIINQPNRYVQVGIVSWGIGCGDEVPAVYASIEANKVWLDRELAALTFNGVFRTRT